MSTNTSVKDKSEFDFASNIAWFIERMTNTSFKFICWVRVNDDSRFNRQETANGIAAKFDLNTEVYASSEIVREHPSARFFAGWPAHIPHSEHNKPKVDYMAHVREIAGGSRCW